MIMSSLVFRLLSMALCMCGLSYTTAFSTVQRTLSTQRLRTGYVLHMSEITDVITQSTNALQQDVSFMQADAAANLNLVGEYLRAVDFSKYWFMFPTAIGVATCAITAGIGGAALFGPIFLIVFPALGPDYPLASPAAAVGIAILTETFGFSSGLLGYIRRGLIDFNTALRVSAFAVPPAVLAANYASLPPVFLKGVYTVLMLSLSAYMIQKTRSSEDVDSERGVEVSEKGMSITGNDATEDREIIDNKGNVYVYPVPAINAGNVALTSFGGAICGLLGVGIGEVTLPQLIRKEVPLAVAAATSTVVVTVTCAATASIQLTQLVEAGGMGIIPWSLVVYTIPGVIIGAQVATATQGRISRETLELAVGGLFGVIGLAFLGLTLKQSGIL